MRSRRIKWLLTIGLLPVALLVGFFISWWAISDGSDEGSVSLAREWRTELQSIQTPEEAAEKRLPFFVIRLQHGDWIIGRTQPSHGIWYRGGGTVVLKDSRGRIQAFHGHVCVPWSGSVSPPDADSLTLDEYYLWLRSRRFQDLHLD
jgi:hypothetical protein